MRSLTMVFFAEATFLLGVVAQANLAPGETSTLLRAATALITLTLPVGFLIAALVFARPASPE